MNPELVLFAVEAAIKLGNKINQVLIDATAERPLLLPLGELVGSVAEAEALVFLATDGKHLVAPNGPWFPFRNDDKKLVALYQATLGLTSRLTPDTLPAERQVELARQLAGIEQFREGHGANSPARRIFGTLVEIAIDYVSTFPGALGKDAPGRKVLISFVESIQDTDFAEGSGPEVLRTLFRSALENLDEAVSLVDDKPRLSALLGGITAAVQQDMKSAFEKGNDLSRSQVFRRLGSSILRGGTTAFSEHVDLFLGTDKNTGPLVQATLTQVLEGLRGKEDLFTGESVEIIVHSALRAVAENPSLVAQDDKQLQALISQVLGVLGNTAWTKLFTKATAAPVLHEVLEVLRDHFETVSLELPGGRQILPTTLAALAGSLSARLAGSGSIEDLLSRQQLFEVGRYVLRNVAQHPEILLAGSQEDAQRTVLAQVIASVAKALGKNPTRVTNGAGFVELVQIALPVVVHNADKLIDTQNLKPETNRLFDILDQVVTAVIDEDTGKPHRLVGRDVLLEVIRQALPVVSANLDPLVNGQPTLVRDTVQAALELANGALTHRINGTNLPPLIAGLLKQVLWRQLDLTERTSLTITAEKILLAL